MRGTYHDIVVYPLHSGVETVGHAGYCPINLVNV